MPKPRTRERWEHPTYKYAYCIERGGTVYTVIDGGTPRAIKGLKWHPSNKRIAIETLSQRIAQRITPNTKPKRITLQDAFIEFGLLYFDKVSKGTKMNYIKALENYISPGCDFDYIALRLNIKKNLQNSNHEPSTKKKYLSKLNRFFRYCVENDYLAKNPIIEELKPRLKQKEVEIFTLNELHQLINYFTNLSTVKIGNKERKRQSSELKQQFALFIKFMFYTGMRGSEALGIYWDVPSAPLIPYSNRKSIVLENKIIIDGKRKRYDEPTIREFPIDIIPGLRETIEQLKKYKTSNNNKLFKWRSLAPLERWLKQGLQVLGLKGGRSLHSIRKTAINYWEKTLNIPLDICSRLAGHGQQIRKAVYDKEPTAEEIITMLEMRSKPIDKIKHIKANMTY